MMQDAIQSKYFEEGLVKVVSIGDISITKEAITLSKETKAVITHDLKEGENHINIILKEEAEADIICVHKNTGTKKVSAFITTKHEGKKSRSSMTIKGVVQDKSMLEITGDIIIDEQAEHSEGYQQIDVLMIGEEAQGKATPKLSINNPLVVCSHGASVGGIDKEQLFYLQSRGLSKEEAEEIIVTGFLTSTRKYIKNKELYFQLQEKIIKEGLL